jgi:hypothetical protein
VKKIKSFWLTISGSISSIIPLFFTVCKSGACGAVCISPIASILGISSATLIASPITQSLFPLLLVISSVSFTISYYKLYVLPKLTEYNTCNSDCNCENPKQTKQYKISLYTFWIGLLASVFFFTYFEYQNYKANSSLVNKQNVEIKNATSDDSLNTEIPCCISSEPSNKTKVKPVKEIEEKACCTGDQKCD